MSAARVRMLFLSLIIAVFAIASAASTAMRVHGAYQRMNTKLSFFAELQRLAWRAEQWKNAFSTVEKDTIGQSGSVDKLLHEMFPSLGVESLPANSRAVASGWKLKEVEVSLRGVSFELAFEFMQRIESPEYGWRVSGVTMLTEYGCVGAGNVVIRLESLERSYGSREDEKGE